MCTYVYIIFSSHHLPGFMLDALHSVSYLTFGTWSGEY